MSDEIKPREAVFEARIARMGSSLYVIVPSAVRRRLGLELGDYVRVKMEKVK